MGLFDSPDEKLRKRLAPDASRRAGLIVAVAQHYGADLSYKHRREVEYVLFLAWLQGQVERHGPEILHEASLGLYASASDQARRIGAHFNSNQVVTFDICKQHIQALPDVFEPQSVADL